MMLGMEGFLKIASFLSIILVSLSSLRGLHNYPDGIRSRYDRILDIGYLENRYSRLRSFLPVGEPVGYIGITSKEVNGRQAYNDALYVLAPTILVPMNNTVLEQGTKLSQMAPSLLFRPDARPFGKLSYVIVEYLEDTTPRDFKFSNPAYIREPVSDLTSSILVYRRKDMR